MYENQIDIRLSLNDEYNIYKCWCVNSEILIIWLVMNHFFFGKSQFHKYRWKHKQTHTHINKHKFTLIIYIYDLMIRLSISWSRLYILSTSLIKCCLIIIIHRSIIGCVCCCCCLKVIIIWLIPSLIWIIIRCCCCTEWICITTINRSSSSTIIPVWICWLICWIIPTCWLLLIYITLINTIISRWMCSWW